MRGAIRLIAVVATASLLLGTPSHAFLPQRQQLLLPRSSCSWNTKLHVVVVEPSHIWETTASFLISQATDDDVETTVSYSKASYYTVLALYIMSFPGLWSQIKRSTSAKVKRKTFVSPGGNATGGKDLRQQAGEIMACKLCLFVACM